MQSASRRTLSIGMTHNLHKRVWQHKQHSFEVVTGDSNATRLVYPGSFDEVRSAIDGKKRTF
jgi:predicted GIY-YIG superfamily endonuclease